MVKRFTVTQCSGIIGINDTSDESYDTWESNGYHGDEPFVVQYWTGHYVCQDGHWKLNEQDVADAHAHCERLNTEFSAGAQTATESSKTRFLLGQVRTISSHIHKLRSYDEPEKVAWVINELDNPMQVMVIGWVYVYEGKMERGCYDYEFGPYEPDVFIVRMTPKSALDVENASCVYSARYNGFGCAIGCLFSDDDEAEKRRWDKSELPYIEDIVKAFEYPKEQLAQCDIKLLDALQRWHDSTLQYGHTQVKRASLMLQTVSKFAPSHLALVEEVLHDYRVTQHEET